jgi:hypothetical protein
MALIMDNISAGTIPQLPRRPAAHRSRVANGSKLLPLTDGRSATARRFRDLYQDIAADLGGLDFLSEGQKQLIRRAAMLSAESERQEAMAARGEPGFDIDLYGQMCDRLGRLFARIGCGACRVTLKLSTSTLARPGRAPGLT